VTGNISSSGTFTVVGDVDATGTIGASVSATGTKTPNNASTPTPPSVAGIYTSLVSGAYAIPTGNITSLDFTGHPVLWANGDVTLKVSSVTGTGTLIVNGNATTGNDVGAAGSPLTFNIVCTGDLIATNKFYLIGSVYAGDEIKFNNQTDVTGVLVSNGKMTLNNHHAFTWANPPSFDTRTGGVVLSSFAGVGR